VVFEALIEPHRDPTRPWLLLLDDEHRPDVVEAREPDLVVWSSLWDRRPDARIRFDLPPDGYGTDLRWVLLVDEPVPDASLVDATDQRTGQRGPAIHLRPVVTTGRSAASAPRGAQSWARCAV
jgi:hypothetical protein